MKNERWFSISMMTLCNANPIIEYDRRRSGLPSAPLDMTTVYSNSPHHVHLYQLEVAWVVDILQQIETRDAALAYTGATVV